MFFVPAVEFDVPSRAEDLTKRDHNRYVKQAVRETMEEYHRKFTRRKFQLDAKWRYGYASRSRKYNARKQRIKGHQIPMLWSGDSRKKISGGVANIRVGGSAEGGKKSITAILFYRLPFKGGTGDQKGRTSNSVVRQLIGELSRWATDEVSWAAKYFLERYMEKVNNHRSRRKRLRMPKR